MQHDEESTARPLTRERVLEALRKADGKTQKRDIARKFGIARFTVALPTRG